MLRVAHVLAAVSTMQSLAIGISLDLRPMPDLPSLTNRSIKPEIVITLVNSVIGNAFTRSCLAEDAHDRPTALEILTKFLVPVMEDTTTTARTAVKNNNVNTSNEQLPQSESGGEGRGIGGGNAGGKGNGNRKTKRGHGKK